MEYYYRNEEQRDSCEKFAKWADRWKLTLYHQNVEKAPWHVYTNVGVFQVQVYPQRIDFYPHKETALWAGHTFRGVENFDAMMVQVADACEGEA